MKTKKVAKHIKKIGSTYYADFTNNQGRRIRSSLGKDLALAKVELAQLRANVEIQNTPQHHHLPTKGKSYIAAVNEFMLDDPVYRTTDAWSKREWDNSTECQARTVLKCLKRFEAHSSVKSVNKVKLRQMKKFLADRSHFVKNSTINKYIDFLKKFFGWCEDMDYIVKSPARALKKLKCETPYRYPLQDKEVNQVLANSGMFTPYFILALAIGLRECEMWKLTQADFEINDGVMFLKKWSEKTHAFLYLPITNEARKVVEAAGKRLFPNADSQPWRDALRLNLQSNFGRSFCRKWNINLHSTRHAFANRCARAGMSKEVLQQLLGHASVKTTEIYYGQLPKETLHAELLKIPKLI